MCLSFGFVYRPAVLGLGDTLASATCWSCSSCCSLICSLTCSCCLAIVIALSSLRSVINCSFCFTAWSLTPTTKRSLTISLVCSLYSQCTASVCSSLANSSTLSFASCCRLWNTHHSWITFLCGIKYSVNVLTGVSYCVSTSGATNVNVRKILFACCPPLHITTSLSARHPLLCGALLRFEILQIRPAIRAIRSAWTKTAQED